MSSNIFSGLKDDSKIKSYISDSNRMTIYMLGTTVSANIYLYNARIKISSSSIWNSKQIILLLFNLFVNLAILIIGLHLTHRGLVFNAESVIISTRTLLIIHLSLIYLSYILFFITLWSFINSFWQTRNIKKLYKQIDKLLYPKKLFKIYYNHERITDYSKLKFQKHLGLSRLKFEKTGKWLTKLQNRSAFAKITSSTFRFMIFSYCSWYYIYILFSRKHKLIEESSELSSKRIAKIKLQIEILCQNLEHVINSNSDKGMQQYCKEWNSLFSKIVIMLFHIECKEENEAEVSDLYRHLLHNHSKLISLTSSNHEQRRFHKQFIITMFSGLAYKEEYIYPIFFNKRSRLLEQIYFEELFELLINLIKKENAEIFTLLQNDEININSLLASRRGHDKYYGSRDRKIKYEELFTSILIKMVELNINEYLPSIMGVILSLRDQDINQSKKSKSKRVSLTMDKERNVEAETVETEVMLTLKNKIALVYAIIKANEVENLKAAGYITKVVSSNIYFKALIDPIATIQKDSKSKRNINFNTGVYKVDFNDYSFQYCLDKTLLLLCVQYFLKKENSKVKEHFFIFADINHDYFLEKFKLKTKEYNMIALEEKNLLEFEELLKAST